MKTLNVIIAVATVALVIILSTLTSRRDQPVPAYNPATETTAHGIVLDVQDYYCPISDEQGTHLQLKTANEVLVIHLGPARFMRGIGARFNKGDEVEVVGSRTNYRGADAVMAREVRDGNELFVLRDHQGKPSWVESR